MSAERRYIGIERRGADPKRNTTNIQGDSVGVFLVAGEPLIEGTRITVRCIAGYYQMGMNVDEILNSLTHLSQAQVHAALTYYFDHQKEIDEDISSASDEDYWKQVAKKG
jgi:uncharacterized protein (DUF433 family)